MVQSVNVRTFKQGMDVNDYNSEETKVRGKIGNNIFSHGSYFKWGRGHRVPPPFTSIKMIFIFHENIYN